MSLPERSQDDIGITEGESPSESILDHGAGKYPFLRPGALQYSIELAPDTSDHPLARYLSVAPDGAHVIHHSPAASKLVKANAANADRFEGIVEAAQRCDAHNATRWHKHPPLPGKSVIVPAHILFVNEDQQLELTMQATSGDITTEDFLSAQRVRRVGARVAWREHSGVAPQRQFSAPIEQHLLFLDANFNHDDLSLDPTVTVPFPEPPVRRLTDLVENTAFADTLRLGRLRDREGNAVETVGDIIKVAENCGDVCDIDAIRTGVELGSTREHIAQLIDANLLDPSDLMDFYDRGVNAMVDARLLDPSIVHSIPTNRRDTTSNHIKFLPISPTRAQSEGQYPLGFELLRSDGVVDGLFHRPSAIPPDKFCLLPEIDMEIHESFDYLYRSLTHHAQQMREGGLDRIDGIDIRNCVIPLLKQTNPQAIERSVLEEHVNARELGDVVSACLQEIARLPVESRALYVGAFRYISQRLLAANRVFDYLARNIQLLSNVDRSKHAIKPQSGYFGPTLQELQEGFMKAGGRARASQFFDARAGRFE